MARPGALFGLAAIAAILLSCGQESEQLAVTPPAGSLPIGNRQTDLVPGPPVPVPEVTNPFAGDQHAIAEGGRLYNQFNCSGCHSQGGGGMGPALMDDEWIYGSSPNNVFWTIVEGRPQGMPAFGGRIQEEEVWRLVAYVRSLSGLPREPASNTARQQSRAPGGR